MPIIYSWVTRKTLNVTLKHITDISRIELSSNRISCGSRGLFGVAIEYIAQQVEQELNKLAGPSTLLYFLFDFQAEFFICYVGFADNP